MDISSALTRRRLVFPARQNFKLKKTALKRNELEDFKA